MNEQIKDIQFLLIMWQAYIDDVGTSDSAWENDEFRKMANKYGFNEENLHTGFESLFC